MSQTVSLSVETGIFQMYIRCFISANHTQKSTVLQKIPDTDQQKSDWLKSVLFNSNWTVVLSLRCC